MIKLSEFIQERMSYDVGDRIIFRKDPEIDGITWKSKNQFEVVHVDDTQIGIALVGDENPVKYLTSREIKHYGVKRV